MAQDPSEYDYMFSDDHLEEEQTGLLSQAVSQSVATMSPSSSRDSPSESDHNSPSYIPSWCSEQGLCKRPLAQPRKSKAKRRCRQSQLNSDSRGARISITWGLHCGAKMQVGAE